MSGRLGKEEESRERAIWHSQGAREHRLGKHDVERSIIIIAKFLSSHCGPGAA